MLKGDRSGLTNSHFKLSIFHGHVMLLVDIGMFILFILMPGCVEPVIHLCLLGPYFICNEMLDGHAIVHVLKPLKTSHQLPDLVVLHRRELDLITSLPFVHALFSCTVSSVSGFHSSILYPSHVHAVHACDSLVLLLKLPLNPLSCHIPSVHSINLTFKPIFPQHPPCSGFHTFPGILPSLSLS